MQGVILLSHGSREAEWAQTFGRLGQALASRLGGFRVVLAYIQHSQPLLPAALEEMMMAGMRDIVVVPAFIASGGHILRDVRTMLAEASRRHPEASLRLAPVLGETAEVQEAMVRAAERLVRG